MKIYVSHASGSDYKTELYQPLRSSDLNSRVKFILPHEKTDELFDSKAEIKTSQWVLAEVSTPSFGVGIELGWADAYGVPIIAVHKQGTSKSNSVEHVARHFLEYRNSEDLIRWLNKIIQ